MDYTQAIIISLISLFAGLLGKIVWDWLKNDRAVKHCTDEDMCPPLNKVRLEYAGDKARTEEKLVGMVEDLKAGSYKFEKMGAEISEIKSDVKLLVTAAGGEGRLFQR